MYILEGWKFVIFINVLLNLCILMLYWIIMYMCLFDFIKLCNSEINLKYYIYIY